MNTMNNMFNPALETALAKMGKELVYTSQDILSTVALNSVINEAPAAVDKEVRKQANAVYTLIKFHQMIDGLESVVAAEQAFGYTATSLEYYNRMIGLMYANLGHRSGKYSIPGAWGQNNFHTFVMDVFGGKIGKNTKILPSAHIAEVAPEAAELGEFGNLQALRERFYAHTDLVNSANTELTEYLKAKDQIRITMDKITIRVGSVLVSMSWADFAKKAKLARQAILVTISGNTNGDGTLVARHAKSFNVFERIALLHRSGVELSGLMEDRNLFAVINVGKSETLSTLNLQVIKVPFQGYITDAKVTVETLAVEELLTQGSAFGPVLNAEQFQRQGYVQRINGYLGYGANAFTDTEGNSVEDAAKLLARLQKLVMNKSKLHFTADNYIIASAFAEDAMVEAATDPSVKWDKSLQEQFSRKLARVFGAGAAVPTVELSDRVGVVRAVSGKSCEDSGQKAMIGYWKYQVTQELLAVAESFPGVLKTEALFTGLGSTKSSRIKKETSGWTMMSTEYKGKTVYFWSKIIPQEVFYVTDSATAGAWEVVVDDKFSGVEAAVDLFKRRIMGRSSYSVLEMLYCDRAINSRLTIDQRIKALQKGGKIRPKNVTKTTTNSQFNEGLNFQFGEDFAKEVMTFLVTQNKAINYRKEVKAARDIQNNIVLSNSVDMIKLIKDIAVALEVTGATIPEGQVWPAKVVKMLADTLSASNSLVVNLDFGSDKVTIMVTQSMLDSWEEVTRPNYVRVSGIMSEILEAISHGLGVVSNSITYDEYELPVVGDYSMSAAAQAVVVDKIKTARDSQFGKELNRVPAIGCNLFLITSAQLEGNEVIAPVLQDAWTEAAQQYNVDESELDALYTKSPTLWMASISGVKLVRKHFDEVERLILGIASFISLEKALYAGNDADGDRHTFIIILACIVRKVAELHPDFFFHSGDVNVATAGRFYKTFCEDEIKGCYYSPNVKPLEFKVTSDTFKSDMVEAVFAASYAKANVARFTSFGQITLARSEDWMKGAKFAIGKMAGQQRLGTLVEMFDINAVNGDVAARALWQLAVDIQNSCVNFDAMDQVKSTAGRNAKKLAEFLSPSDLSFLSSKFATVKDKEVLTEKEAVARSIYLTNERIAIVREMMFGKDGYNLAYNYVQHIFPVGTTEEQMEFFISTVLVYGGMFAGVAHRTTYCPYMLLAKDISDASDLSMDTLLADKAEMIYTDNKGVEHFCEEADVFSMTKFILQTAITYVDVKLQTIKD